MAKQEYHSLSSEEKEVAPDQTVITKIQQANQ